MVRAEFLGRDLGEISTVEISNTFCQPWSTAANFGKDLKTSLGLQVTKPQILMHLKSKRIYLEFNKMSFSVQPIKKMTLGPRNKTITNRCHPLSSLEDTN